MIILDKKNIDVRKVKNKSYTSDSGDLKKFAYIALFLTIILTVFAYLFHSKELSFSVLIGIPALVGLVYIFGIIPSRIINSLFTQILIKIYLYFQKMELDKIAPTVIILGKHDYTNISFWESPGYGIDLIFCIEYLKKFNKEFSIHYNVTEEKFDNIMDNKKIEEIYLLGHGRKHAFAIDKNNIIYYCKYANLLNSKKYIYQMHCNSSKGKSLVEYCVIDKNKNECMPEDGFMNDITCSEFFIDKLIKSNNLFSEVKKKIYVGIAIALQFVGYILWTLIMYTIYIYIYN